MTSRVQTMLNMETQIELVRQRQESLRKAAEPRRLPRTAVIWRKRRTV